MKRFVSCIQAVFEQVREKSIEFVEMVVLSANAGRLYILLNRLQCLHEDLVCMGLAQ